MRHGSELCFLQPSRVCCDLCEEEHWVLWVYEHWMLRGGGTMSIVRRAYYPNSFTQTNTLCSVFFSCQNEQIWCFEVFFIYIFLLAYNPSSLCKKMICVMWYLDFKMSKYDVWVTLLKTSMFLYNPNSFKFIWILASNFCLLANSMCSLWLGLMLRANVDVTWFFTGINDFNIDVFGRKWRWGWWC